MAFSLFVPFAATLQGALLCDAVAAGVIGWVYHAEARAALEQRRWNARLNLPLAAMTLIVGVSAMLALDATTAPTERDGARQVAGARRSEVVPMLPVRTGPASPPDSSPGGAAEGGAPSLFERSTTGELTDAEVSAKAIELARQLFDEAPKPSGVGRGASPDSAYDSTLKPAEMQIRKELERRTGVSAPDGPTSCQLADAQPPSGPHPLRQHALCLLDLAKLLDQPAQ